jgi:lysophospholipase L1-like esterase
MIDCLIIGDSIAVGTKMMRPDCVAVAKGGINSWQWRRQYLDGDQGALPRADTLIISLGSNDHKGVNTREEISRIRSTITAKRVYWIMPAIKPEIQTIVQEVAAGFGDTVIPITRLQPDGVHPSWAGYKEIAAATKL